MTERDDPLHLALYRFDGCPWCERVRAAIDDLGIEVEERDTRAPDSDHGDVLDAARGRRTVPVLRIERDGDVQWLPESADIVRYLYDHYGDGRSPTFLASGRPQRWGLIAGVVLLLGALAGPDAYRGWVIFLAAGVWLLGMRAPLLRTWR
jgi:glutathione S-transferase